MFTTIFWIIQVIMGSFALLVIGISIWVLLERFLTSKLDNGSGGKGRVC